MSATGVENAFTTCQGIMRSTAHHMKDVGNVGYMDQWGFSILTDASKRVMEKRRLTTPGLTSMIMSVQTELKLR